MAQNQNFDSKVRFIGILCLSVIIFALLYNALLGGPAGFGYEMQEGINNGMNYGVKTTGFISDIFFLAGKILWLVFLISLIATVIVMGRKYLPGMNVNREDLIRNLAPQVKCRCGAFVKKQFKYCPSCGTELKAPMVSNK